MAFKFSNFFRTTLSQPIEAADLLAYIPDDDAADLPTLGALDRMRLVIWDGSSTYEIIDITDYTDGDLTIERAKEGTVALDWPAGSRMECAPTAEMFAQITQAISQNRYVGTSSGTSAYTVTLDAAGAIPTLSDGEEVTFVVGNANTSETPTLAITNGTDTTTAKNWVNQLGGSFETGDLEAGLLVTVSFVEAGDHWRLKSPLGRRAYLDRINSGPLAGTNRARNSRFEAWRNGTSIVTPASEGETCDGWYVVYDGTIGAFTVSRQDFAITQSSVPGNPRNFARWDQSSAGSASTKRVWREKLPNVAWRTGEKVTRSLWVKADTTRSVDAKIVQHFGTGGSPSADVVVATETWNLTTSWQQFDISATMSSMAGKTLGSAGDDAIFLDLYLPLNVTMTIDVAQDQVEPGDTVTPHSGTYPIPTWLGGTGLAPKDQNELADALVSYVVGTLLQAWDADLDAISALASTGLPARTGSGTWALRTLAVGTGLSIADAGGVAGNPTISLGTPLANYQADPLSVSELASITGDFGTAAFVANNTLVHLAGTETITGEKLFQRAVDSALSTWGNTTTTHEMEARMSVSGTFFELTPAPSGTPDANKGFGYDFTNVRWFCDTSFFSSGPVLTSDGSLASPAFSFASHTNYGIYYLTGDVGFCAAGVAAFSYNFTRVQSLIPHYFQNGSVGAPSRAWINDTTSGTYRIGSNNFGESVNGTLVYDWNASRLLYATGFDAVLGSGNLNPSSVYSVGYRGTPIKAGDSAYNFALHDAGCRVYHNEVTARTWTIPANASVAFPIGSVIVLDNTGNSGAAGAITLSITSDTLRRGDGISGTGSRTIAAGQVAVICKVSATEWVITGTFS